MKHQIILVGGQLLPALIGEKEFLPDKIHLLVSSESKSKTNSVKSSLSTATISENICNPFDFASVLAACEKILNKLPASDEVLFNLTGGTKIMLLAAQSIMQERNLTGFYINQDDTLIEIPSYTQKTIEAKVSIKEFLSLSGHVLSSFKTVASFSSNDYFVSKKILDFCDRDYRYKLIMQHFSRGYKNTKEIPDSGAISLKNKIDFSWNKETIKINGKNKFLLTLSSPIIKNLFFNSAWWELVVAAEVAKYGKVKELYIQAELPFKTDNHELKNEIDILVNSGNKLIFIECKSGKIRQEDINKMKIVKDVYGGVISKSLLACFEMPSPNIMEKCKELEIEVFCIKSGRFHVNPIGKINGALEKLILRSSI